jgi:hypothetical protein
MVAHQLSPVKIPQSSSAPRAGFDSDPDPFPVFGPANVRIKLHLLHLPWDRRPAGGR